MLFKLIFIIAAIKLHDVVVKPLPPTVLFMVPVLIIEAITSENYLLSLVAVAIYSLIIYAYFWALTRFDTGMEYWATLFLGAIAIVIFI